jgi:hypothetical protein
MIESLLFFFFSSFFFQIREGKNLVKTFETAAEVSKMTISRDFLIVACASAHILYIWDLSEGEAPQRMIRLPIAPETICLPESNQYLFATSAKSTMIALEDMRSLDRDKQPLSALFAHSLQQPNATSTDLFTSVYPSMWSHK